MNLFLRCVKTVRVVGADLSAKVCKRIVSLKVDI